MPARGAFCPIDRSIPMTEGMEESHVRACMADDDVVGLLLRSTFEKGAAEAHGLGSKACVLHLGSGVHNRNGGACSI